MSTNAFVMRNSSAKFETVEYKQQLTKARLVPEAETQTLKTLDPATVYQDVDNNSWTFEIGGIQGWDSTTGLCEFLHDNHGLEVEVVLQPKVGTGERTATFTVIAKSQEFGGEQGNWAEFETELGVVGQPVFGAAV